MCLTMVMGGIEGNINLWSGNDGNLTVLNMGVRTWPGMTRVVRICGH